MPSPVNSQSLFIIRMPKYYRFKPPVCLAPRELRKKQRTNWLQSQVDIRHHRNKKRTQINERKLAENWWESTEKSNHWLIVCTCWALATLKGYSTFTTIQNHWCRTCWTLLIGVDWKIMPNILEDTSTTLIDFESKALSNCYPSDLLSIWYSWRWCGDCGFYYWALKYKALFVFSFFPPPQPLPNAF